MENGSQTHEVDPVTVSLRQALIDRRRSPTPYSEHRFHERGIVICAGGPRYFTCAWVLVSMLRRVHRVELPIQVWHLGRREMSEEMRVLLEEMRVEVVDAETVIARFPARIAGGWPLKPYAIAHSRFREVLYLDADTVPLVDPRQVFDWDAYRRSGMLMWPNVVDLQAGNPIWHDLGLAPRDCASVDAAILVVDKQRAWDVLDVAVLLNEHIEEVYYAVHGDKDTFQLSSLLLDRGPALVPHRPFVFDIDLVHRDPAGEPFLHHRTGSKWNLFEPNRPLAITALMRHCEQALAELRQRWNGVVFHLPERPQRARAEEARLAAARHFHYQTWTAEGRMLELLPSGRVGEGRSALEQHWAVIERDGALVLQFFSATRLTVELTASDDGSWQGRSVTPAAFIARLVDERARRSWPHETSERVARSAADWVTALLEPSLFAAGFDAERARELRAALSLINDRFDDVPERLDAQLAKIAVPEPWCRELADLSLALASRRDDRIVCTARSVYPQVMNPTWYDRVP
jgi:hypothetical protein